MLIPPSVTPPAVSLADIKLHLRIDADNTAEDALLSGLIDAATRQAEHITGRALVTQSLQLWLSAWPGEAIELPRPPVTAITSIVYYTPAGAEGLVPPEDYTLIPDGIKPYVLRLANSWPDAGDKPGSIRVTYSAGYGNAAAVPGGIVAWIKCQVGSLYANRESVGASQIAALPYVDGLLDPYRTWRA